MLIIIDGGRNLQDEPCVQRLHSFTKDDTHYISVKVDVLKLGVHKVFRKN